MRRTIGRFTTGVAVVTTLDGDQPHGMTVNSLTSVSLDPPMLLVCLSKGARTADCVVGHGSFAVNILASRQVARTCDREGQPLAFISGRFGDVLERDHEPVPWFF